MAHFSQYRLLVCTFVQIVPIASNLSGEYATTLQCWSCVVYTHKKTVVYGNLHWGMMRQRCCQLMQHNREKLCEQVCQGTGSCLPYFCLLCWYHLSLTIYSRLRWSLNGDVRDWVWISLIDGHHLRTELQISSRRTGKSSPPPANQSKGGCKQQRYMHNTKLSRIVV